MTAARLRAAAAVLREVAESATPGPWVPITFYPDRAEVHSRQWANEERDDCSLARTHAKPDAAYIATMSPPVALAVAAWLEAEAEEIPPHANMYRGVSLDEAPAVRVADAVLGDREQVAAH